MIIEIKNKQYDNPDFSVENGIATLKIVSEASFSEITEDFVLESGDSIIQFNDNEEQIGEFYIQSMASVQLPGEDGSDVVTIKYHVTQLGLDAQEALNDDLDVTTLSVLELAGILATAKQNFTDVTNRMETNIEEHNNRISTVSSLQNSINERMSRIESLYDILADRVARLENVQ